MRDQQDQPSASATYTLTQQQVDAIAEFFVAAVAVSNHGMDMHRRRSEVDAVRNANDQPSARHRIGGCVCDLWTGDDAASDSLVPIPCSAFASDAKGMCAHCRHDSECHTPRSVVVIRKEKADA